MSTSAAALLPGPFEDVSAAVFRYVSRPPDRDVSFDDLGERLLRKRRLIDMLELDFALDAAQYDTLFESQRDDGERWVGDYTSSIAFLTNACRMSPGNASNAVRVGEQAETLRRSVERMQAGAIGFAHLAHMAHTSFRLRWGGGTLLDEERLLRMAETKSPHQFARDCGHARHAADARRFAEDERDAATRRFFEIRREGNADDGVWVRGYFDPAGAAILEAAIKPLSEKRGADDHRAVGQRQGDGVVEMCMYTLNSGGQGATHRQVPHLQVTTTLETLLALPGAPAGEINGGPLVSSATVRSIACSANVRRILMGPKSEVLNVGRTRRVPTVAQRIAVEARDRGCVWPGCDRRGAWTQIHHTDEWMSHEGQTNLSRLRLLCTTHHDWIHVHGWEIVLVDGQREVLPIPPRPLEPFIRGPAAAPGG
jgi:hypothetical protein